MAAADLLATWEAGLGEASVGRALLLHRAARPDADAAALPALPVGEREADLITLRRALFGERMEVRLACAACGQDMEFDLDTGELAGSLGGRGGRGVPGVPGGRGGLGGPGVPGVPGGPGLQDGRGESGGPGGRGVLGGPGLQDGRGELGGPGGRGRPGEAGGSGGAGESGMAGGPGERVGSDRDGEPGALGWDGERGRSGRGGGRVVWVQEGGWDAEFRLPSVADLHAAARAADPRAALLARCLVSAAHHGTAVPAAELPAPVQRRIAEAVEAADPGADLTLNVACPECGAATRAELDIASYLWTELDSWARDVLLDVHLLATAYGWSEPEILALSPLRRRYYLELCADA
ncbi:hypothetical protein AB0M32_21875 [Streptomyces sp. NPDC051985]|uniref:hypothetical protein n=1 Tax=Streptomyces sp. NPDC051985 TaxID=3155807 RepID=UPI00343BDF08